MRARGLVGLLGRGAAPVAPRRAPRGAWGSLSSPWEARRERICAGDTEAVTAWRMDTIGACGSLWCRVTHIWRDPLRALRYTCRRANAKRAHAAKPHHAAKPRGVGSTVQRVRVCRVGAAGLR